MSDGTKEPSRQRQWQIRQNAAGKCMYCSDPLLTSTCCEKHAVIRRERIRNLHGHQQWKPGSRGRKPAELKNATMK